MGSISYFAGVFASLLLHSLVIVLMLSNWQTIEERELKPQPRIVKATLIELETKAPEKKTEVIDLTARREAERRAEEARQLAQRKRDEEEKKRLEEQRKKEEAQKLQEQKEQERLAEEKRQQELEQQRRERETQQRLDEFQQALAEEEGYQAALEEQQLVDSVGYQIERVVEQNWSRPPSARRGMETVLRVSLVPTGGLSSVEIMTSSGDNAFDRSAMQAVQKAAPFDAVKEISPVLFEKNFRTFQFRFSPQDLRL